ncbi:MAG: hypothetical protein L0Y75_05460 [Acidobacteria bacterium]|nr:hypothetical protein [Acidobacteriota bacterium]
MAAQTANDISTSKSPTLMLSHRKLKALEPELYSSRSWQKFLRENGYRLAAPNEDADHWKSYVEENLRRGDFRAAVVVSTSPLLIAAYAGELDCIAMLRFTDQLVPKYDLSVGTQLLAVNLYLEWNFFLPEDLNPGPRQTGKYGNFAPLIADFLTDDVSLVEEKKAGIAKAEWRRAEALGREYLKRHGEKARDGRPLLCHLPAKEPEKKRH